PIVDAGRDLDFERAVLLHAALPAALGARGGDDPSLAPTARAGDDVHHLAQDRLRHPALLPGAVAVGAGLRSRPGLAAGALAAWAGDQRREADLAGRAEDGIGEVDRQVVAQVGAGNDPLTAARAGR